MSLLDDGPKQSFNLPLYAGILIFIILAGAAGWHVITKPKIDKETLCELDIVSNTTVILFDKTGGFSANQQRIVSRAITTEVDKLVVGDRLTIYEIDDKEYMGLSKPIFDSCRPKDSSETNELYENKQMIAKTFNVHFLDKLKAITATLDDTESAISSPIIESLNDISALYNLEVSLKLKRLIIVSDLLQHSGNFSFYKTNIKEIDKDKLSLMPDLFGTDIQVFWLQRSNREQKIQNSGPLQWWEQVFETSGVNDFSVMKVR
jgi:hypothetical protein